MSSIRDSMKISWLTLALMILSMQSVHGDTLYLLGFDSAEGLSEIAQRIAPAKPFASPIYGFALKGEIVSAQIDPDTGEGFLTASIWWRSSSDTERIYSQQPVRFSFDEIYQLDLEFENDFDVELMLADKSRGLPARGSLTWFKTLDSLMDPDGNFEIAPLQPVRADRKSDQWPGILFSYVDYLSVTQDPMQVAQTGQAIESYISARKMAADEKFRNFPRQAQTLPDYVLRQAKNPFSPWRLQNFSGRSGAHGYAGKILAGIELASRSGRQEAAFQSDAINLLAYASLMSRAHRQGRLVSEEIGIADLPPQEYRRTQIGSLGSNSMSTIVQLLEGYNDLDHVAAHPDYASRLQAYRALDAAAADRAIRVQKLVLGPAMKTAPLLSDIPFGMTDRAKWLGTQDPMEPFPAIPWAANVSSDLVEVSDMVWWGLQVIKESPYWPAYVSSHDIYPLLTIAGPPLDRYGEVLPSFNITDRRAMGSGADFVQPLGTSTSIQREARQILASQLRADVDSDYLQAYGLEQEARQTRRERRNLLFSYLGGSWHDKNRIATAVMVALDAGPGHSFVEDDIDPADFLGGYDVWGVRDNLEAGSNNHLLLSRAAASAVIGAYYLGQDALIKNTGFGRSMALKLLKAAETFDGMWPYDYDYAGSSEWLWLLGALGDYHPTPPPKDAKVGLEPGAFVEAYLGFLAEVREMIGKDDAAVQLEKIKALIAERMQGYATRVQELPNR